MPSAPAGVDIISDSILRQLVDEVPDPSGPRITTTSRRSRM